MRYSSRLRLRMAALFSLLLAGLWLSSLSGPLGIHAAHAQDAPPAAASPDDEPPQSALSFYFNALGLRYTIAFLFLSFETLLNEKRYQEAYELAKNDESFLGHVLSAGLAKLQDGYAPAVEAMQEVGEDETMKLEQRLSYIALIGTVSPMVGLLGTVDGMVAAFQVIARSSSQPKPSQLAQGISMALITTLVGLWLAIPAIALFGIFRNRLSRLVLEVGIYSERLMSRFQNVGTKKTTITT
jgi:biopolymer transport protein ExbB